MNKEDYLEIANYISDKINELKFDYISVNSYTRHLADDVFTVEYTVYNSELERKEHVEVHIDYGYAGEDSFYVTRNWDEDKILPEEALSTL